MICHSFGLEQINLDRTEVVCARGLAEAGFPVLRYHTQGYGDSEERSAPARLAAHLDAAADAAALLNAMPGVEGVGLLGARFGALVAALVAERTDRSLLGLWHPFKTGQEFLDDSFSTTLLAQMMGRATGAGGGLLDDRPSTRLIFPLGKNSAAIASASSSTIEKIISLSDFARENFFAPSVDDFALLVHHVVIFERCLRIS